MVDDFDTKIDDMENEQDGVLEGTADVDALASDSAAATANEVDAPEGTAVADAPEDAGAAADDAPRIPEFLQHPATGAASRTSQVVDEEPVPTEEAPGASPVEAVGSFFSEGAAAVREMSAARMPKRASSSSSSMPRLPTRRRSSPIGARSPQTTMRSYPAKPRVATMQPRRSRRRRPSRRTSRVKSMRSRSVCSR